MAGDEVTLWQPRSAVVVPKDASTADAIVTYARQLTERERSQVVSAFQSGSYEIGSVFLWSRTMAGLKKRLGALGLEFIGEMLDRPDIVVAGSVAAAITDHEALGLAEQLGMFSGTDTLKLRQALDLVVHFGDTSEEESDGMMPEDAMHIARACELEHTTANLELIVPLLCRDARCWTAHGSGEHSPGLNESPRVRFRP
ncbi:MAG TPA: hypothetical protein VHC69_22180 [Polyangiaceae bacterium]|nr:hypothetical protein [Polyangiaceae bacterium]